ncbi:MAG: hypothetical protein ACOYOS_01595 [Syntrophales bacterium]
MVGSFDGAALAASVLGSTGGAGVKRVSGLDSKFSWVDAYLRDNALRNKIQNLQAEIAAALNSLMDRDDLKKMFISTLGGIERDRITWFVENLKAVQAGSGTMINSHILTSRNYIPPVSLSGGEIDAIFKQLPEGVKRADIDTRVAAMREEVKGIEEVISRELSPRERWIFREDGLPHAYPQGCRWTQFVIAWRKVISRYSGEASVDGDAMRSEQEKAAYYALGLDKVSRTPPFRD